MNYRIYLIQVCDCDKQLTSHFVCLVLKTENAAKMNEHCGRNVNDRCRYKSEGNIHCDNVTKPVNGWMGGRANEAVKAVLRIT